METYSVKKAAAKLGISTRAVQKRCFRDNVPKKSNQYKITEEHVQTWYAEMQENEKPNEPITEPATNQNEGSQDGTHEALNSRITILEEQAMQLYKANQHLFKSMKLLGEKLDEVKKLF